MDNRFEMLSGKKLLVCEDHPINAHILLTLLEKADMTGVLAQDGKQGTELFSGSAVGEFCAVIMDMVMPEMDGFEATRTIRQLGREDSENVPIIAMSADGSEEDIKKAFDAGADRFVVKPVDTIKLYEMLCELLVGRDNSI